MNESVVFFGSGPVAAESLRLLLKHQTVESVITKPTTARDMSAIAKDIPVHSVSTRSELDELIADKQFSSKLGVLIDFGIIVSQYAIDYFPLGIINSHFSVLPEWRGADPISFAILSGQKTTGVSLMVLTAGMDEGPLLSYGELPITKTETTPSLTEKLINLSDALLAQNIPLHFSGQTVEANQEATKRLESYSRKLTKNDGIIDWNKSATVIEREIRAFIDWPKSRTTLGKKEVILIEATVVDGNDTPGSVKIQNKGIVVHTGEKSLLIQRLKPVGKKEMTAAAFLAGYRHLLS